MEEFCWRKTVLGIFCRFGKFQTMGENRMKKHCKRKHYALVNPITFAIAGACITDSKVLADLYTRELSALEAMTHGRGGLQEWHDLSAVLNLCETAANLGIGPEALPYCQVAQEDLIAAARRFEATKRMGLTGEGVVALRHVLEYHHLQRQSISRSDYEKVIATTGNRIRAKTREVFEV